MFKKIEREISPFNKPVEFDPFKKDKVMSPHPQKDRLMKLLFSNRNERIVDFRTSLEDGHGLDQEEIYKLAADVLDQVKSGRATIEDNIDGDMPKINIDRFLGEKI